MGRTLSEQVLKEVLVNKTITDVYIHYGYKRLHITLSDDSEVVISADHEWQYIDITHYIGDKLDNNIVI